MITKRGCALRQRWQARGLHAARRVALVLAVTLSGAVADGCSGAQAPAAGTAPPSGSVVLTGAGSTFDAVLFDHWFTAYHESHPKTVVNYDVVGSGEGVRRFMGLALKDGEAVDFGASDSAMSDAQLAQTSRPTLMIPVTGACVVLAYHLPGIHSQLKLSRNAYAGIFLGDVNRWNDPRIAQSNPGLALPDLPIGRMVRQDSSGTTFAFTSHLAAINDTWRTRFPPATLVSWPGEAMRGQGNEGVAGLIKNFEASIGYVGFEFAHKLGLDVASLENREGQFVQPSALSCAAGLATADLPENLRAFVPDPHGAEAYPIVTFSWVLLRKENGDPALATNLRDLFRWCLQEGQGYAAELDYVPLPATVTAKALQALNSMDRGGSASRDPTRATPNSRPIANVSAAARPDTNMNGIAGMMSPTANKANEDSAARTAEPPSSLGSMPSRRSVVARRR